MKKCIFVSFKSPPKSRSFAHTGGGYTAKVRVYLNVGTESNPQFSKYFCAQSGGGDRRYDLTVQIYSCTKIISEV